MRGRVRENGEGIRLTASTLPLESSAGDRATSNSQRIVALDILRGLALCAMILVPFHQKMESPAQGAESLIGWIIWVGFEAKGWATFAFLFGAGFAVLMRRAEARGRNVVPLFLRRMLGLAIIGFAVTALTGFRILLDYAFWGVILLLVRNWSTRALLILALFSAIAGTGYRVAREATAVTRLGAERAAFEKKQRQTASMKRWRTLNEAESKGTYTLAVRARTENIRWSYLRPQALIPSSNLVLFILGLLAIRHRIFDDPRRNRRIITTAMSLGAVSWAAWWQVLRKLPDETTIAGISVSLQPGFGIVNEQWLALTYIGGVTLLLAYRPEWKRRLSAFGTAGRMALTNYVLQAVIISLLATGYGLSLKIRPYFVVIATVMLFAALASFSHFWVSRFRHGPLESLWRSLTYGEWHGFMRLRGLSGGDSLRDAHGNRDRFSPQGE